MFRINSNCNLYFLSNLTFFFAILFRFKVVKIESTEPFKKGRWTCMDYFDHTTTTLTSTLTTGTNRISVASSSPNPQVTQVTPTPGGPPLSHPSELLVQPPLNPQPPPTAQQGQSVPVHLSPPQIHQQQVQQIPSQQQQQQPQIQMVPTTTEIQHGGEASSIPLNLNGGGGGGPSYPQHLTHMNLNPHLINVGGGMEYQNQSQGNPNPQNVSNPAQNLYQQNPVQQQQQVNPVNPQQQQQAQGPPPSQQQQQYYGNANLIQGAHQSQQGQQFQQQPMEGQQQGHSVSIPVQQISQQYSQNQQPIISQQQQHPGQSLPHGAVTQQQMAASAPSTTPSTQHQVAQSLGHDIQKQTFLPAATTQQQQVPSPSHFQNPQELGMAQGQAQMNIPPQQQQQQGQGQSFQQMMTGIPTIHQQHHIQHVQPMQIQVPQSQQSIPQSKEG